MKATWNRYWKKFISFENSSVKLRGTLFIMFRCISVSGSQTTLMKIRSGPWVIREKQQTNLENLVHWASADSENSRIRGSRKGFSSARFTFEASRLIPRLVLSPSLFFSLSFVLALTQSLPLPHSSLYTGAGRFENTKFIYGSSTSRYAACRTILVLVDAQHKRADLSIIFLRKVASVSVPSSDSSECLLNVSLILAAYQDPVKNNSLFSHYGFQLISLKLSQNLEAFSRYSQV